VSKKKNMSSRFASAPTRRTPRRRVETLNRPEYLEMEPGGQVTPALRATTSSMTAVPTAAPGMTVAPPRVSRAPVPRPTESMGRAQSMRRPLATARPTGVATIMDYRHLRGDLRRIVLLSVSLLVLLIVLNLVLNH